MFVPLYCVAGCVLMCGACRLARSTHCLKHMSLLLQTAPVAQAVTSYQRASKVYTRFFFMQICVGITRVFIPDKLYDAFVERAVAKATAKTLGDQWSGADIGPLVDTTQMERVLHYIDLGVKEGARLVCGGRRWGTTGCYVEPTIFADVTDGMVIAKEEIFGPVMCCLRYSTVEEVWDVECELHGL